MRTRSDLGYNGSHSNANQSDGPGYRNGQDGGNGNGAVMACDEIAQPVFPLAGRVRFVPRRLSAGVPRWKRIFDITCIALTCPVWAPLMLMVMALIRVASPGPIFYRQERVGFGGRRFMLFKFRTMHVDAGTGTHEDYVAELIKSGRPMAKLDSAGDSRLIPGAGFLRACGLDELPQIFNILKGDMSLVGPRPCLPREFVHYESWQKHRVEALPGLTGLWQVSGKNETTFKEMIVLDLQYVRTMSLSLDLEIILKTIPALNKEVSRCLGRLFRRLAVRISVLGQPQLAANVAAPDRKS